MTRDITEGTPTETDLRSRAYLAAGERLSHTGCWAWNVATGKSYWSEEHFRILGLEPGSVAPSYETFIACVHPEDRPHVRDAFDTAVRNRVEYESRYRIVRPDGTIRYLHSLAYPVVDASGAPTEYVGTFIDETERVQYEQSLRAAKNQLEMILDSLTDRFFAFDSQWRYTRFNARAEEQLLELGKDPATLIGKVLWDEFPDPPSENAFRRAMRDRIPVTHEHHYAPLGEWVENRIYPSPDGGVAMFVRYVTQRKRAEQELRRTQFYLAEGQKLSHTGSWAWNVNSGDLYWSDEHFRIFGLDPTTMKPSYPAVLQWIHPDDRSLLQHTLDEAVRARGLYDLQCRVVRPDGTIRHIHSMAQPMFNESGELTEYVGKIIDLTDRREADERLHKAQAELAHVTRVTTIGEMAASIAHEVNQPLTAIATFGRACRRWLSHDPPNIPEALTAINEIVRDAHRASDIIQHTRALLRKTHHVVTILQVNEVITEAVTLARSEVQRYEAVLQVDLAGGLPPVSGDRVELQQVILNLVINALEALRTIEDGPRDLQISSRMDGPDTVRVAVRDSGRGVDPDNLPRIFDAFYTTKHEGIGMGLSISRSIIEAHGGRLWASANEGSGTTFSFTLPSA